MRTLRKSKPQRLAGNLMVVPVSIGARFSKRIEAVVKEMTDDAGRSIRALFESDDYAGDYGMDANVGSQARILISELQAKWEKRFNALAPESVAQMQPQAVAASGVAVAGVVTKFAPAQPFALNPNVITAQMREMLTASAAEATALIKRIPAQYLEDLSGSVMRSIVSGNGLKDLIPELARHNVTIKNWAKNTALDQTRKVYTHTNIERMKKGSIRKFEWVHSGGGAHPRKLHQEMSGKIYSLDDPPFIGVMYGLDVKGFPSDLPACKCVMRFLLDFGGDDASP
jgi:SPP1 gp7 family putative phage head morphogenesis protein